MYAASLMQLLSAISPEHDVFGKGTARLLLLLDKTAAAHAIAQHGVGGARGGEEA